MSAWIRALFAAILLPAIAHATQRDESPAAGERLYQTHCASCHGHSGEGDRGPALNVPRLIRAPTDPAFLQLIASGIPGTEMPRFALQDSEAGQLVAWVRQLGRLPVERVPGDPDRGARLYWGRGACQACHYLRGEGGALGPDLTEIGLKRGAAYLRTALVDPGAQVPRASGAYPFSSRLVENFLYVRLVLHDGRQISGVRVNEDTFSIQIRDLSGSLHSFHRSEMAELHKDWGRSPMPAYGDVLAPDELDDVVAFLLSLRGEQQ